MSPDEFRRIGAAAVEFVARYMERLQSGDAGPVLSQIQPGDLYRALPEAPPERPQAWDDVFADLDRLIAPALTHWQSPQFYAYFPANASGPAIIGELLAAGLGVNGFLWQTSPAITELELRVLDWLADMLALPSAFKYDDGRGAGGGVIQGTASEAALVAMVAARHRARANRPSGALTAYASTQAHSSILKAAIVSGVGRENVRLVPVDQNLAMRPQNLAQLMDADAAAGAQPFFVCATVGTTSTGAVDPLEPIGAICAQRGVWMHVDAAYAGAALVCPEFRDLAAGVERADSFNFNPHKWLLTNFDCSAMWVRERRALIDALSITPEYLRNAASESGAVDYRDWQIPLGRRFRALKLWLVIRHYGVEGLRAHIREHVRLAELLESLIREDERFQIVASRCLSLVCFRLRAGDAPTRELMNRLNRSGRLFFTHSVAPGPSGEGDRLFLRMAIGGTSTREEHVREAWRFIAAEASSMQ